MCDYVRLREVYIGGGGEGGVCVYKYDILYLIYFNNGSISFLSCSKYSSVCFQCGTSTSSNGSQNLQSSANANCRSCSLLLFPPPLPLPPPPTLMLSGRAPLHISQWVESNWLKNVHCGHGQIDWSSIPPPSCVYIYNVCICVCIKCVTIHDAIEKTGNTW